MVKWNMDSLILSKRVRVKPKRMGRDFAPRDNQKG